MESVRLQNLLNEDVHLEAMEVVRMAIALLEQMLQRGQLNNRFLLLTPNNITVFREAGKNQYWYVEATDTQLLRREHNLYGPSMEDETLVQGVSLAMYSLGMVMYQLVNGNKLPYIEDDMTYTQRMEGVKRHFYEGLPRPSQCADELADVILKACHLEAQERYQCIEDMLKDLRELEKDKLLNQTEDSDLKSKKQSTHHDKIKAASVKSKQAMQMGNVLRKRYRLEEVIGSGGFGITYEAWDEKMSVKVAIKEYLPKSIASRADNRRDVSILTYSDNMEYQRGLTRFIEEAKALAQFSSDPVVVNVFDYFEENRTAYIVMEYLDGQSLNCELKENGAFSIERGLFLMQTLALTFAAIHEKGIVHRDINPDNVFICKNGKVRILDFGAAKYLESKGRKRQTVIVTPQYAPIEQFQQDSQVNVKMDIYALGATMYKAFTGITPVSAIDRIGEDKLVLPEKCVEGFPEPVQAILLKCMELDAGERYHTMMEIVDDVEKVIRNHHLESEMSYACWNARL